jgi:hypothetical protein
MAKSRFTKSFYFLSTVFVDNFVENDKINYMKRTHEVYGLLNIALYTTKLTVNNQALTTYSGASENWLPIISAAKKIVHKWL